MFQISDYIDDTIEYAPGTVQALKHFKSKKTFTESTEVRLIAMQILVDEIAVAYSFPITPTVIARNITGNSSGNSSAELYRVLYGESPRIIMEGKLSIITLLHELAHILLISSDELLVQRWAINLFRKVYPKQFAKLRFDPRSGLFY